MNITQDLSNITAYINSELTFKVDSPITLDEIKSSILQHLGVPNYSSFISYAYERTHMVDLDNSDNNICLWNGVSGVNEYRWYNLHIVVVIGYNNDSNNFYIAICKDGQLEDYQFNRKSYLNFGYYGFMKHLTTLLEF